ncbi:hypothetical protein LCR_16595 [Aeromonas enteropelogenes]|uniref:Uncharacterized protein n=1 Tax=Aeromonas enteropelogenes TaxID=29489 RepID=A0A175VHG8_AEREN|nr:hypothetical protein LCR_16595 [Aeromonas enteropelogenes]
MQKAPSAPFLYMSYQQQKKGEAIKQKQVSFRSFFTQIEDWIKNFNDGPAHLLPTPFAQIRY